MTDSEIRRIIRDEIKQQVNILLFGSAGTNTPTGEDIDSLFPGMPTISNRPIMHPFGISSRAPAGTIQVIGRMGDHAGNRTVLGHRDSKRPAGDVGETFLYDAYGHEIYLSKEKIQIGSKAADEPFVLGLVFQKMMDDLIQLIAMHTHITTVPGVNTTPPNEAPQFLQIKASPIDDKLILSDEIFGEKVNGS